MNSKNYRPENFKKLLLNRLTVTPAVTEYIECCLATDDEEAKHFFHKVMVHSWTGNEEDLFNTLLEYFNSTFIPINCSSQGNITTFYTSSLSLVLKILSFDFMFPFQRNMFNLDVLFNDKTSEECFGIKETVEEIVSRVVSKRFSGEQELDLSNFCADSEFKVKKVNFYKFNLLSNFKILMLRMGRDTKALNLSNNNFSQVPMDVLNFFIKGDLTSVNLSNNNIPSISELMRVSSKIEKLWIEGNPLCEEMDPASYVKQILVKFPRLSELDGVKINQNTMNYPFFRNYMSTYDRKTKMVVDKFLTLYFSHYDSEARRKIEMFYDNNAKLSISHDFRDEEVKEVQTYESHSRNVIHPVKRKFVMFNNKLYSSRSSVLGVHKSLPRTEHDPSTFTVDVLDHGKLIIIVDGVFREKESKDKIFRFRRTFLFNTYNNPRANTTYQIANEMYSISWATKEQRENSFKQPIKNLNSLSMINPEAAEVEAICKIFCHLTQLRKEEVLLRLKVNDWDLRKAIKEFINDMNKNSIMENLFLKEDEDDVSDLSSISDHEVD